VTTPEQQLAGIIRPLKDAGIDALVMGGHAVRYYDITRNTNDFDLATPLASPEELRSRLSVVPAVGIVRESAVWRKNDFAPYEVGPLSDGREEWLEFWIRDHLLRDFNALRAEAETGSTVANHSRSSPFPSNPNSKKWLAVPACMTNSGDRERQNSRTCFIPAAVDAQVDSGKISTPAVPVQPTRFLASSVVAPAK
jgi:hypothetical protein